MGRYADFDQRLMSWLNRVTDKGRAGVHAPDQFVSLGHIVHEMRLYKSSQELKAMRKAASIAAEGHCRAMALARPGMREYQVEPRKSIRGSTNPAEHSWRKENLPAAGNGL